LQRLMGQHSLKHKGLQQVSTVKFYFLLMVNSLSIDPVHS
jgi:hypothetical protein